MKPITPVFFCAALLLTACGGKDEAPKTPAGDEGGEVTITAPEMPQTTPAQPASEWAQMSAAQLTTALDGVTAATPLEDIAAMTGALSDKLTATELQTLSNNFWAGKDGLTRNRTAATALSKLAYEAEPAVWSQLRTGMGYINGTGVAEDAGKAAQLLSGDLLKDNAAAAYFLSLAYKAQNDVASERAALVKAQALGHPRAAKRLAEIGG